jgi:hypothetical protein
MEQAEIFIYSDLIPSVSRNRIPPRAIPRKIKKLGISFRTICRRREEHSELSNFVPNHSAEIKMIGIPFLTIL